MGTRDQHSVERPGGTSIRWGPGISQRSTQKTKTGPVQTTTRETGTPRAVSMDGTSAVAGGQQVNTTSTPTRQANPTTTDERPTNMAIRRVLARGVPDCTIATLYAFARNANVAAAREVHRFPGKLRRGEVFTFVGWRTVADRTGLGYSTVKRHVRPWKDTGAVEVRQVSRTMRLMVFVPEPASEPASEPADMNHVREPREEPQTPSTPCRKRVAHPDRPATARQTSTILAMADERGLANPLWATITRGQADDMIQYIRAQAGALVRRVYHHGAPPTAAQLSLLVQVLGVADAPATRGAADAAIQWRTAHER